MLILAIGLLIGIFLFILLSCLRYQTVLKALISRIGQSDPEWFRRIDGHNFFSNKVNSNQQLSLFHYIIQNRYKNHSDPIIIQKCQRLQVLVKRCVHGLSALFAYICLLIIYIATP